MRIIDKKIQMYEDAIAACKRREHNGLNVEDDLEWLNQRLKQFKQERDYG